MQFAEIKWTQKMRTILADESRFIHLHGATGTSKTLIGSLLFFDRAYNSPPNVNQFAIVGVSSVLVKRNFIDKADSIYQIMRELCSEFSEGNKNASGSHFCINGKYGRKIVYIAGADNKASYTSILSLDLGGILLDELSALHIDVVREAYSRVQRLAYPGWVINTSNGGLPTQECYTEFVNHAKVMFPERVPKQEMDDMIQDKEDEHYYHFNLRDDCPHKPAEQTERLISTFVPGSFYYNSKVMGCRGNCEGALYATLLDGVETLTLADLNTNAFEEFIITVDRGKSVNAEDTKKSHTIIALLGYSRNYHRLVSIASKRVTSIEHLQVIEEAENWIYPFWLKFYGKIDTVLVDNALGDLITTWQNHSRWSGKINIIYCKKAHPTLCKDLIHRASRKCQLFMKSKQYPKSRVLWCDQDMLKAHRQILQDKDGSELDQADLWQDYADCFSYAMLWRVGQIFADDRDDNKMSLY